MAKGRVQCFLLEPVDLYERTLRRAAWKKNCPKPAHRGTHEATLVIDRVPAAQCFQSEDGQVYGGVPATEDPRWDSMRCGCGYRFQDDEFRQLSQEQLWHRADDATGALTRLTIAPAGAMWRAPWFEKNDPAWTGIDGRTFVVMLPGGHQWVIDSRARNCDSLCRTCGIVYHAHHTDKSCGRYVDAKPHKCWNRVGEPPNVTAGKDGGPTCTAGGGSILAGKYHGHLRNGWLEEC